MTLIVTSEYALSQVTPPNLPLAPLVYDSRYQEQFNNVLRLYFNQLNKIVSQLRTDTTSDGSTLTFPNGAFYQDGVTTLTANITNVSTTPIQVTSTADFALTTGGLIIGTEIIGYTGKTATTFTGITRGMYGSTKAAHTAGATVTEAQTLASPTVAAAVTLLQTTASNQVALDATDKTKIVFSVAGYYNIQFSIQMVNYDGTIDDVTVWWRQNGVDIPYSAGIATVPAIHGGVAGTAIISWSDQITNATSQS
ncbi:hypothetical protein EBT31_23415 [bacterium]|nr:hypothetical protein [bacterium]